MPPALKHFDAVVVGARVAGTAATILLARAGRRVLLVDKDSFPSDTLSTHIVLGGGTKVLAQMGVLEMLERAGGVRFERIRTVGPDFQFQGSLTSAGADERGLCLSRLKMDAAMVDAARSYESVTFRERFRMTDLLIEGGAVVGIRGEDSSGAHEFRAPLTIGADGLRSRVAQIGAERLEAFARTDVPCARAYYYGYFTGADRARLGDEVITEFEARPGEASLVCRCENGRAVAAVAFDARRMHSFRTDLGANLRDCLDHSLQVGKSLAGAALEGKIYSSGLLLNTYCDPVANGALLLGDAGLHVDPLFGQGHSLALMSAAIVGELAPQWVSAANSGAAIPAASMAEFTRRRDAALMPYFNASLGVSRNIALENALRLTYRAVSTEQWAADEVVRFANMCTPRAAFPSFRLARLMATTARAA